MTARATDSVPVVAEDTLRAAYWKAAHEGIDGAAIDPLNGRTVPVEDLLTRLIDRIRPALDQLDDLAFVTEPVAALLAGGARRGGPLNAFRTRGRLSDVVGELAEATLHTCR